MIQRAQGSYAAHVTAGRRDERRDYAGHTLDDWHESDRTSVPWRIAMMIALGCILLALAGGMFRG